MKKVDNKKDTLRRYAEDRYSFKDYLSVKELLSDKNAEKEVSDGMFGVWRETKSDATAEEKGRLSIVLERLHNRMAASENDRPFRRFLSYFSRVAAVLIIPALLYIAFGIFKNTGADDERSAWAKIYSPAGTRTEFHLPDGTEGWLNSCSSISYPLTFGKSRQVSVEGEAWLHVSKKEGRDFIVNTKDMAVKVLGTKFNVSAYPEDPFSEVILEEGKVAVLDKYGETLSELKPDEKLVVNNDRTFTKEMIDARRYTSWKEGMLIFKNEPMWRIAEKLSQRYNTDFIIHDEKLRNSIFRATFKDERIENICLMLSAVAPIRYTITPPKIQKDSTFTKTTVEMWLK